MPVSTYELKELKLNQQYARFIHTNLHVHTPATPWDWDSYSNQTINANSISPNIFFERLNKTSLELVAITDHNSVEWCEPLIKLAKQARKEKRSTLHILPGVEITTYEGPHLLAIFDEDQDINEIREMLVRLGLSGDGKQEDRVGLNSPGDEITIPKVLDEVVDNLKGLVIAPHVKQKDGIWGARGFRGRNGILNDPRLRILAASSGEIKKVIDNSERARLLYKSMDSNLIKNSFGFINVSDCHRLDDFELNTTWIKMAMPSLNGIRQIVYEPELRVSHQIINNASNFEFPEEFHFTQPTNVTHPYIIGFAITGGMLDGLKLGFSPHQNSIIGKNYAGKSALLDCLRFIFNSIPMDPDTHSKLANRLSAFIGNGGEARAYLQDEHGRVFGITRTFSCTQIGRGSNIKWQIEGIPAVFLLWDDEFKQESDLVVDKILHLEVYPQGEVVKIKDNANQQMRIVNSLAKVENDVLSLATEEIDGEKTILGRLVTNGKFIIEKTERKNDLETEVGDIEILKNEIKSLEELVKSPLFDEKKEWSNCEVFIDGLIKEVIRLDGAWNSAGLLPGFGLTDNQYHVRNVDLVENQVIFDENEASPKEFSTEAKNVFVRMGTPINKNAVESMKLTNEALQRLQLIEADRKKRSEQVEEKIRENLLYPEPGSVEGGLIDRITEKQRRLNDLQQKEQELKNVQMDVQKLLAERAILLRELNNTRLKIRESRIKVVKVIDRESASNIKASLLEDANKDRYRSVLSLIADRLTNQTNKIVNKESQIEAIITCVSPDDLVKIVREGDTNKLTQVAHDVTVNTARIIVGMGLADIHTLEECSLEDKFIISYKRIGDKDYTPVDSGLSGGEQALALISVAMIPKKLPLIIDQPEDELGPALITKELVEQVRHVKLSRQLIFVTHVPNIPILADSEQVIYVAQEFPDEHKKIVIKTCGSLDVSDVVSRLLELDGGDMAFLKRSERYSAILHL